MKPFSLQWRFQFVSMDKIVKPSQNRNGRKEKYIPVEPRQILIPRKQRKIRGNQKQDKTELAEECIIKNRRKKEYSRKLEKGGKQDTLTGREIDKKIRRIGHSSRFSLFGDCRASARQRQKAASFGHRRAAFRAPPSIAYHGSSGTIAAERSEGDWQPRLDLVTSAWFLSFSVSTSSPSPPLPPPPQR